ncbi:hypothetical protein C8F01DRAFT_1369235 [Mycena amicta]|nr:hypothetical protein C8F01DRAFT_1369235 [Mycena amicta]
MSLAGLPSELLTAIVDELRYDLETVKRLSLVASPLRGPTQRHLFRHVNLYQPLLPTVCLDGTVLGSFRKFPNNPHIAAHIQQLTIRLPPDPNSPEDEIALAGILTAVEPRIQQLTLVGSSRRWTSHSQLLTSALLATMAAERLSTLDIHDLHRVPVQAVYSALVRVQYFSMTNCTLYADGRSDYSGTVAAVEQLHLRGIPQKSIEQLISGGSPKLGRLTKLTIKMLFENHTVDVRRYPLLVAIGPTLQELDMECDELSTVLRLPRLPHLRVLTLHIHIGLTLRMPRTFPATLRNLPAVTLRVICKVKIHTNQPPWHGGAPFPVEPCAVGLNAVLFLFEIHPKDPVLAQDMFEAFCAAIRRALPEHKPMFERVDSLIVR